MHSDEYRQAYEKADRMFKNEEDYLMQEMLENMSIKDQDTLRDRLADAIIFGQFKI